MQYKKYGRRRRVDPEEMHNALGNKGAPRKYRGGTFTFLSFFSVIACMAVMKAVNPDVSLRAPAMMFASVVMACVLMIIIARRMK